MEGYPEKEMIAARSKLNYYDAVKHIRDGDYESARSSLKPVIGVRFQYFLINIALILSIPRKFLLGLLLKRTILPQNDLSPSDSQIQIEPDHSKDRKTDVSPQVHKVAIFLISLRGGGAERIVSYLLNEGYKEFEYHLILLKKEIAYQFPLTNKIKIVELKNNPDSKYLGTLVIPYLARKLKNYLVENNIQTMLSLLNRPNIIACYVKKLGWKGKLIISERADPIAYYNSIPFGFFIIRLIKRYYNFADVITSISKGIASSLKSLGVKDCTVIYNPIYISKRPPKKLLSETPFTFINIARLEQQKNHAMLLTAFSELKNEDCKLVIVGKGKLLGKLKNLSRKLGIDNKVFFVGYQPNVESYLSRSDCFVFSSDFEGLGNAIIEALNEGVPVISTDCPCGPREILAPDTEENVLIKDHIELTRYGFLTPVGSSTHLAEAMRKIMEDKALRIRCEKLAVERANSFDVKIIARQYFDLF